MRTLLYQIEPELSKRLQGSALRSSLELKSLNDPDLLDQEFTEETDGEDAPAAVVIGPRVRDPLLIAQRLRRRDPDVEIVLLSEPERLPQLKRSVLFASGVGTRISCRSTAQVGELATELVDLADGTARRRDYLKVKRAVTRQMAELPLEPSRPAPHLFAEELLRRAPVGVVAVNGAGEMLSWNPMFVELLDGPRGIAVGRSVKPFFTPSGIEVLNELLESVRRRNGSHETESKIVDRFAADGRSLKFAVSATAIQNVRQPGAALLIFQDITDRLRLEEDLRQTERNQRFLAEAGEILGSSLSNDELLGSLARLMIPLLADGCIVDVVEQLDGKKTIARRISAHSDPEKEFLLKEIGRLYPPGWESKVPPAHAIRTGKPYLISKVTADALKAITRDGRQRELGLKVGMKSALAIPMIARAQVVGAITLFRTESDRPYAESDIPFLQDLARRAAIAIENARLYERAEAAIRIRDEFISICSHELKTPVTSMQLHFQMARRQLERGISAVYSDAAVRKRVDVSIKQLDRLGRLIEDMLDVSRITTGRLQMDFGEIDIRELAHEVTDRLGMHFTEAGIEFRVHLPEGPLLGVADRYRLEQVFTNLITNALKYGRERPVEVTLESAGDRVRFTVRDEGIGISPEAIDRIFHRFERGISSSKISGLGLGLYISHQIMEAHQGNIHVTSEFGTGSTFTAEWPLQPRP